MLENIGSIFSISLLPFIISSIYLFYEMIISTDLERKLTTDKRKFKQFKAFVFIYAFVFTIIFMLPIVQHQFYDTNQQSEGNQNITTNNKCKEEKGVENKEEAKNQNNVENKDKSNNEKMEANKDNSDNKKENKSQQTNDNRSTKEKIKELLIVGIILFLIFLVFVAIIYISLISTKNLLGIHKKYYIHLGENKEEWLLIKIKNDGNYILEKDNQYKVVDEIKDKLITDKTFEILTEREEIIYKRYVKLSFFILIGLLFVLCIVYNVLHNECKENIWLDLISILFFYIILFAIVTLGYYKFVLKKYENKSKANKVKKRNIFTRLFSKLFGKTRK